MDFWPKDDRNTPSRQRTSRTSNRDYPYLEPGLIGAAALLLTQTDGLQWEFLVKTPSKDVLEKRLKVGKQFELFPATRSPPTPPSRTTVRQRAEQGANFLRTFLPDLDITSDLIREHLTEEAYLERSLEQFDPLSGKILDVLSNATGEENLVLFPVGELGRALNISSMQFQSESESIFRRWESPAYTYPTPIKQIESNYCAGRGVVITRTFGDSYVSTVHSPKDEAGVHSTIQAGNLRAPQSTSERFVDVKLASNGVATAVTEKGEVLQYDLNMPAKTYFEAYRNLTVALDEDSDCWHIIPPKTVDEVILMSANHISQIDFRAQSTAPLFSLPTGRHVLTHAERQREYCIAMSSTKEMIWIDTRFPGRSLLALTHGRQYDRSLQLFHISSQDDQQLCVLHSRFNSMMTIYDVNKTQGRPLQLNDAPYFLPFDTLYDRSAGKALITHHNGQELLCLREDGRLTQHPFRLSLHATEAVEVETIGNAPAEELDTSQIDQLAQRAYSQVDMSNSSVLDEVKQEGLADPEDILHAVDQYPRYLQSKELPTEYMLTAYDVAFRSGTEPEQFSRSDFLASSSIKSTEGFQSLLDGKFSPSLVKAPFKASIADALSKLGTQDTHNPSVLYDSLKRQYVGDDPTNQLDAQQRSACQQLTMDLALSSTVVHETAISPSQGDEQVLETMAGALSLGGEPPPYVFGYLRPLEGFSKTSYDEERRPLEAPELPIGIRLLMKTWDSHSPDEYEYEDPYIDSPSIPEKKSSKTPVKQSMSNEPSQPRPPVVGVAMPPTLLTQPSQKPRPTAQSQDVFATRFGMESGSQPSKISPNLGSSQTPFASTQVVPGPFGGRPQTKKKPVKKRIGGF